MKLIKKWLVRTILITPLIAIPAQANDVIVSPPLPAELVICQVVNVSSADVTGELFGINFSGTPNNANPANLVLESGTRTFSTSSTPDAILYCVYHHTGDAGDVIGSICQRNRVKSKGSLVEGEPSNCMPFYDGAVVNPLNHPALAGGDL